MKKIITIWLSLVLLSPVIAQKKTSPLIMKNYGKTYKSSAFIYRFEVISKSYERFTDGTLLAGGGNNVFDDPNVRFGIPFPFSVLNVQVDSLDLGYSLGVGLLGFNSVDTQQVLITPFEFDAIDRGYEDGISMSTISYKIEGATGARILKVQWDSVGSYGEWSSTSSILQDYASFQLWLYEGSNDIEFHFGPRSISNPNTFYEGESGPAIGILGNPDSPYFDPHFIIGNQTNPELIDTIGYFTGEPNENEVFAFTTSTVSVQGVGNNPSSIIAFPNPASNEIMIASDWVGGELTIRDVTGKVVQRDRQVTSFCPVNYLPKGMYFLELRKGDERTFQRLVIER